MTLNSSLTLLPVVLLAGCASLASGPAVERHEYLQVDDAQLYMAIRGEDEAAPLLIWLHGGPGGAERPLFRQYNAPLEDRFVIVYLDQRGTARSYDREADPNQLSIARHLTDLNAVVDHLLAEFGKQSVILVGHSWGSALGLLHAQAHPRKVAAFVGVGQLTSEIARQQSQYEFVRSEARQAGDAAALSEIERIGPPPFAVRDEITIQRFVEHYGGYWRNQPNLFLLVMRAFLRGHVMPWELPRMFEGNNVSLEAMNDELLELDLPERVPSVDVPVVFMLGRHDRQVDSRLAAAYFQELAAPAKTLMWFDTAHNIPFEDPDAFNAALPELLESFRGIDPE